MVYNVTTLYNFIYRISPARKTKRIKRMRSIQDAVLRAGLIRYAGNEKGCEADREHSNSVK